ncbi:AAA family ATPase [Microbispora sp. RL4-1S]|uniref:AAA family ATPase n=1 Tax=Microbispora oryzae TaxID=2806554 RepID=A0A940WIN8_9ACTN|nr:LuxR family transcriptional regulator [Microbispora oryzae]MBP2705638.1 AAA family ATPase [Microbispora oryzae]
MADASSHAWAATRGLDSEVSSWPGWRGRAREWSLVVEALRAARDGQGSVVLVEGSAGTGKSVLLARAADTATCAGFPTGRGAADELDLAPLSPLRDAIRQITGVVETDVAERGPMPVDLRLAAVRRLTEPLEKRAAEGPVLVALDDLQWADPLTLLALRCMTLDLGAYPCVWVLSRASGPVPGSTLDRLYGRLERDGAPRITLGALDERAVAEVVADVLGAEPEPDLLAVAALAEGNPFRLVEILDRVKSDGAIEVSGGRARMASEPRTGVRTILRRRIDGLSPPARELVQAAAVLGRTFAVADVAALLGRPAGALTGALDEAVSAGLLLTGPDQMSFRHELLRGAVTETLSPPIRLALHREAGQMLLDSRGSAVPAAPHLILSARPGDVRAIRGLDRAAAEVLSFSPQTAVDLSTRALEISDPADPDRWERVAVAVHALTVTGRSPEAIRLAHESLVSAPPAAAPRLRCALAYALLLSGRPSEAVAEAERVLAAGEGVPGELRGVAESALYLGLLALGRFWTGRRRAEAALADPARCGDTALAGAHLLLAQCALADGKVADSFEHVNEAVRIASTGSVEPVERPYPRMLLYKNHKFMGRYDEAELALRAFTQEIERLGQYVHSPQPSFFRAGLSLAAGRLDDAVTEAQEGLLFSEELGGNGCDLAGLYVLAVVAVRRGDLDTAARYVDRWRTAHTDREILHGAAWGRWARAVVAEARGDLHGAMDLLHPVHTDARELRWTLVVEPLTAGWLTRLALAAGDRRRAEQVARAAEALARDNAAYPALAAAADHARGLVEADPEALERAADAHPDPWGRASAAEDLGVALIGDCDQRAARALERALDGYEGMGALRDAARVRARLRALGVHRRHWTTAERPNEGWESLTGTERAVAALVAEGLTNRQAAARMFLSPHTVSTHLRHIFAKLGIASRVELARLAAERRLAEPGGDGDA